MRFVIFYFKNLKLSLHISFIFFYYYILLYLYHTLITLFFPILLSFVSLITIEFFITLNFKQNYFNISVHKAEPISIFGMDNENINGESLMKRLARLQLNMIKFVVTTYLTVLFYLKLTWHFLLLLIDKNVFYYTEL